MPLILTIDDYEPVVHESAWVAPNATLVGRVTLHADSSVYYGTVLRGDRADIVLGAGSNLQDNVTVHCDPGTPTIIGTGVSVGHGAVLHGCIIEDDVLIGMSATVLNRAVVGTGSLVAAGAVILEDTVIPPRSLVAGVPAKVRRQLTDEEVARVKQNGLNYLEITASHKVIQP
ncbi:MAG: gamma carbonic anhydrase family protein [Microbacteriaceae bacterium]|nr:gamma carbonic anhydrase family protein [Microbacteriaceae bacterium]